MSDMQAKLRAISGLSLGTRVIGEKPFGERVMSTGMSNAQKAEAKRIYARAYYVKHVQPLKKKRRGAK